MVSETRCHVCDPWCLLGPPWGPHGLRSGHPWGCGPACVWRETGFTLYGQGSCASPQVRPLEVDSLFKEEKVVPGGLLKEDTSQKDSDSSGALL